ncbi:hypothetical protein F5Y14DRAFT_424027 [Nemania sp. NC0429]|nr:hypothetical protein F5Y14DRAFT_424027 [Nemania sp. NC0429]
MSNLGPLPTDFLLSSSHCRSALDDVYYVGSYYLVQGNIDQVTCYPNEYAGQREQYYSPARCPGGFTPACSMTNRIGKLEETISICCPTNRVFACQSRSGFPWESTLGCVFGFQGSQQQTLDVIVASDLSTSLFTLGITDAIGAYSVQVRYQSTDFISSTPSPSASRTNAPTSTTSTTISSTNTNTGDTNNGTDKSNYGMGINGGAAAGIAVGAFAAGLTVTVAIWYLVKQKRRQRRQQLISNQATAFGSPFMAQQQQQQQHQYHIKHSATDDPQELRANEIYELPNNS